MLVSRLAYGFDLVARGKCAYWFPTTIYDLPFLELSLCASRPLSLRSGPLRFDVVFMYFVRLVVTVYQSNDARKLLSMAKFPDGWCYLRRQQRCAD